MFDLGEREDAVALAGEALELARRGSGPWDIAFVLTSAYGYVHQASGALDEAERAYLEADRLWSDPSDEWGRSLTHNSVAVIAWRRGDLARAEEYARAALDFGRCAGDRWFASRTLQVLGYVTEERADYENATRLFAASDALRSEVGARLMPFEVREWSRAIDSARQSLGDAAFDAVWNSAASLDFDERHRLRAATAARERSPTAGQPAA
jgi:tetratricopeptide (TPR) repeat protein